MNLRAWWAGWWARNICAPMPMEWDASEGDVPVRPSRAGVRSVPSEHGVFVEVNADAIVVEEFLRADLILARSGR